MASDPPECKRPILRRLRRSASCDPCAAPWRKAAGRQGSIRSAALVAADPQRDAEAQDPEMDLAQVDHLS